MNKKVLCYLLVVSIGLTILGFIVDSDAPNPDFIQACLEFMLLTVFFFGVNTLIYITISFSIRQIMKHRKGLS